MTTIFIKHEIKSEADLPEPNDSYFVIDKKGYKQKEYLHNLDSYENKMWVETFACWLEEKEISALRVEQEKEPLSAAAILEKQNCLFQSENYGNIWLITKDRCIEAMEEYREKKKPDLRKLEKNLDDVLAKETKESLNNWLDKEKEPLSPDNILEKHCMGEYFMNKRYRQLKHIRSRIIEAMREYRQQGIDWDKIENEFYTWGFQDPSRRHILGWFKSKIT